MQEEQGNSSERRRHPQRNLIFRKKKMQRGECNQKGGGREGQGQEGKEAEAKERALNGQQGQVERTFFLVSRFSSIPQESTVGVGEEQVEKGGSGVQEERVINRRATTRRCASQGPSKDDEIPLKRNFKRKEEKRNRGVELGRG